MSNLGNLKLPDLGGLGKLPNIGTPKLGGILDKPAPEPDPLAEVEYTGDLAEDAARELTALEQGYRDRAKREGERFRDATDSEYWVAVCFTSREEKEAFIAAAGIANLGDKYIRGRELADKLGIRY